MPTYEYSCQDCGEKLEVVQSIHDDSLTECPNCGGKLRKLFGNVGVVFKGSGFYKTDSRAKSTNSGKSGSSSSEKKSESGSSSGSDKAAAPTKSDSSSSDSSSSGPSSSSTSKDTK